MKNLSLRTDTQETVSNLKTIQLTEFEDQK